MSFVGDVFKGGNITTGLAIGIGSLILAPIVVPVVVAIVKPLAKVAVQGGVALYKTGRNAASEVGEAVSDIVAEAKADLDHRTGT
jgi:hypothetical protein